MKETISSKKNHVIVAILSILAVILLAAVYLQERQFSRYKETENSRTELKAGGGALEKGQVQNNKEQYQNKITMFETQIVDMQEKQDHMEAALNEYGEKDAATAPEMDAVSKAKGEYSFRRIYSALYKDFIDQNNYPPELNEKLVDLLVEKMGTMGERMTNPPKDWENPKEWSQNIEFNRQTEAIKAQYDEKIAALLPEGGLALFKEYEKRSMERALVFEFKTMLGDDTLEIEKERELIELLCEDTQTYAYKDKDFKNIPGAVADMVPEKKLDEATLDRLSRESAESMIKTYEAYVESAEAVLSESQLVKFEGMINSARSAYLPPDDTTVNSNETEKDKK